MTPKTYTQQRAVLRPNRNVAFFDDDDFEDDMISSNSPFHQQNEMDTFSLTDDTSSFNSVITNTDTLMLAQFLASTGPEEFLKPTKQQQQNPQFHRASRLFNKLRKKGGHVIQSLQQQQQQQQQNDKPLTHLLKQNKQNNNNNNSIRSMKSNQSEKKNYIPLPVYQPISSSTTTTNTNATNTTNNTMIKKQQSIENHSSHDFLHPHDIQLKPSLSSSSSSMIYKKKRNLSISSSSSSHHTTLRDSGIYSETSDKCGDDIPPPLPSPPMIPSKSYYRIQSNTTTNTSNQPKRPAPLPPAIASAAIASATNTVDQYTSMDHSSSLNQQRRKSIGKHPIPSAALKRKSITRIRHIQVQTDNFLNNNNQSNNNNNNNNENNENENNNICKHCQQHFIEKKNDGKRRTSCPSILPTGQLITPSTQQLNPKDAIQLLSMIEQLKLQLVEEQKSRLQLEEIIQRQLNGNKL